MIKSTGRKIGQAFITAAVFFIFMQNCSKYGKADVIASADPENTVLMGEFYFNPKILTVGVNTEVHWVNKGFEGHTVTSDSGSELKSGNIEPGGIYSHTFTVSGIYKYHCSPHEILAMVGKIIVTN